jgi:hypothetical protein
MATPKRPHRGHRLGLPWAARRWLLGARVYYDDNDEIRNSGIARLRFLVVGGDDENWKRYLAELQREYGPLVPWPRNAPGRPVDAPERHVTAAEALPP